MSLKQSTGGGAAANLFKAPTAISTLQQQQIPSAYNPTNKLITSQFIEGVISALCGYTVRIGNLSRYQLAFVHKSVYQKDIAPHQEVVDKYLQITNSQFIPNPPPVPIATFRPSDNNPNISRPLVFTDTYEAMEFSGDGWVNAIIGQYVTSRFPGQSESFYHRMKSFVVCKDGLSKIGMELGFGEYALVSQDFESLISRKNPSLIEDIVEAFCEAVVQDLGIGMLRVMLKNLIEKTVDFRTAIINDTNYKDVFKRKCKELEWSKPVYVDLGDNGMVGTKKEFTIGIKHDPSYPHRSKTAYDAKGNCHECLAIGNGPTKKKAEQSAALNAISVLSLARST